MATTIRDVAERAGVSVATASRVLTGSRPVSPELAERVIQATRELGYRHNAVARALRRGHTNAMGMVVPEIGNPFFPTIVEAVERRLQETGRDLFLCDAQQDPDLERRRVLALIGRQVDGLVIVPVSATASGASLAEAKGHTPLVQSTATWRVSTPTGSAWMTRQASPWRWSTSSAAVRAALHA